MANVKMIVLSVLPVADLPDRRWYAFIEYSDGRQKSFLPDYRKMDSWLAATGINQFQITQRTSV